MSEQSTIEVTADNYIGLALRTNNPDYNAIAERLGNPETYKALWAVSTVMQDVGDALDNLKKNIFYGRPVARPEVWEALMDSQQTEVEKYENVQVNRVQADPTKIDLIHGIIGVATESAELLAQLNKILETGEYDAVNILEEVGDKFWYQALILHRLAKTVLDAMGVNIHKLAERFPDGYSDLAANNRNLDNERALLEDGFNQ